MANTSPVNDTPEVTRYMLEQAAGRSCGAAGAGFGGDQGARRSGDWSISTRWSRPVRRLFSDDGIPIDDQAVLAVRGRNRRAGLRDFIARRGSRADGHGAVNAGEVSKRLGVAGIPATAESASASGATWRLRSAPEHRCISRTSRPRDSLDLIRAARKRGAQRHLRGHAASFHARRQRGARDGVRTPRWRRRCARRRDVDALHAALADGTIDMIATDHAPHDPGSKQMDRLARTASGAASDRDACPRTMPQALTDAANGDGRTGDRAGPGARTGSSRGDRRGADGRADGARIRRVCSLAAAARWPGARSPISR